MNVVMLVNLFCRHVNSEGKFYTQTCFHHQMQSIFDYINVVVTCPFSARACQPVLMRKVDQ